MLLRLVDMPSLYPEIKISENLNEERITDSNKNEQHTDDQYRKSTLSYFRSEDRKTENNNTLGYFNLLFYHKYQIKY